jgi:hypothetical protein
MWCVFDTHLSALASSKMYLNVRVITMVTQDFVREFVQGMTVDRHVHSQNYCSRKMLFIFK